MDVSSAVDSLKLLAASSVNGALVEAEALRSTHRDDPDLLYLLAELNARSGRPHDALDLIDEAQRLYRRNGSHLDAERCDVGRIAVLDDLGRHDDAVRLASVQLSRLAKTPSSLDVVELEVRVLGNRAFCYEAVGRYADAAHDYELAVLKARLLGDELLVARLQVNRANVLDFLGRTEDSLTGLRDAASILDVSGERGDRVTVATHIGRTLCRRGEYDEGLKWFHRAEQLVEQGTDDECDIAVESADAMAGLGALSEALARYRSALEMLTNSPLSWLEGRAWLGIGLCSARLGDKDTARDGLLASIAAFQAAANTPSKMTALLELATLEGDDPQTMQFAADEARRVLALTDLENTPIHACAAHLKLAEFASGADGERHLRAALRLAKRVGLAPLLMRVEQRLGRYLLSHRRSDAAPHVRMAVAYADALSGRIHHRSLLRSFPTETAACYDDLVELLLGEGDAPGAFDAADRARSRSLVDLAITRSGHRQVHIRSGAEAELHAIYDRLLGVNERLAPSARLELERRARELEVELDRSDFDLAPDESRMSHTARPEVGDVRPDLTLLYIDRGESFDLLVRHSSGRVEHHAAVAQKSSVTAAMTRFHADGRRSLALRSAGVVSTAEQPDRHLRQLGADLLGPVVSQITSRTDEPVSILVLPSGPLHAVPFSALACGERQLIDHAVVTVAASAALHDECRRRTPASDRVVIVGISAAGIPGVVDEVESLAGLIPATVLLDDRATIAAVGTAASGAKVVHLASHGLFRPEAPLQSGVRLADGWLTAAVASNIDFTGALVVLSACDTGRARIADGGEILGLQYGFFAGGAACVVMSLWPAHDASTALLMRLLYTAHAAGVSPARALRSAQLALREANPHPWWWSAFAAAGAG